MISVNIGDANHTFGGAYAYEFGIGCVQVADTTTPATTRGMLVADAEEQKVQGRGGSYPIKSNHIDKMVSNDTTGCVGRTSAAANVKPVCLNNVSTKDLSVKVQSAIVNEMGTLARAGVFKPLKKATSWIC